MLKSLLKKVAGHKASSIIKKDSRARIYKNFSIRLLLVSLESDCLGLFFWKVTFKHPDLVILQKYQSLSNKSFKHNSAHVSSLHLTPALLDLGFVCSSLTVTIVKANVCNTLFKCPGEMRSGSFPCRRIS